MASSACAPDAVIENARRNAWTRGVAAALRLASEHVGAAVPEAVLASLGADALDPGMLAEALLHIADGGSASVGKEMLHATNLLAFAGKGGLTEKLAAIRSRIFISRSELALIHGVPASSARLPIFYAIRIGEVLLRYARSLWALKIADPRLAASAARHARLDRWINQA